MDSGETPEALVTREFVEEAVGVAVGDIVFDEKDHTFLTTPIFASTSSHTKWTWTRLLLWKEKPCYRRTGAKR